jgi:hypothetical protein
MADSQETMDLMLAQIMSMGFSMQDAVEALRVSQQNPDRAVDWYGKVNAIAGARAFTFTDVSNND